MKKRLLFGALVFGAMFSANAQGSCSTAVAINANGTYTSAAITGTYGNACWGGTQTNAQTPGPLMANWYSYTPAANGLLTISSDVEANPATTDTRLSVFTGTCNALVCYNGNDDINGSAPPTGNYASELTIPVAAGTTYYIAWDNVWNAAGFQFTVDFVESGCLSPNDLGFNAASDITTTSATVSWDEAIGAPANYDVKWGAPNFNVETEGTLVSTNTNSASLTGLTENGTVWYYVRSNCGGTQGSWVGPFAISLAVTMPYSNNFDAANNTLDGFDIVNGWGTITSGANTALAHSPSAFVFSNVSSTAAVDSWMLMRPVSLVTSEDITINFQSMLIPAAATGTLQLTVGSSADVTTHETIASWNLTGVSGNPVVYTPRSFTYNAPAAGVYYFGLRNNSGTSPANGSILVDTVVMTSELSTETVAASQFAVYPNPATNVINIANAENILVNGVEIIDINGRTVKSMKFNNVSEAQINISDLSAGMYLMNISSDKGSVTKKIVKN